VENGKWKMGSSISARDAGEKKKNMIMRKRVVLWKEGP
jgi:hypothetical protein